MKIELKSIEYSAFASHETDCYAANLYVDGRKIGAVSNDGQGGCDNFRGDHAAYGIADAWCKATLPKWSGLTGEQLDTDLELHCGDLLETWLAAREMKKTLRTNVLFIDADDGKLYQVRHRGQIEQTIAVVARAHSGASILNRLSFDAALVLYRAGTVQ